VLVYPRMVPKAWDQAAVARRPHRAGTAAGGILRRLCGTIPPLRRHWFATLASSGRRTGSTLRARVPARDERFRGNPYRLAL